MRAATPRKQPFQLKHWAQHRTQRAIALAGVLLCSSACGNDNPAAPNPGNQESALNAAESRWSRSRPVSNNYVMEQQVRCFCPDGGTVFEVTVTQGRVVRARNLDTGAEVPVVRLESFRTVEQLFGEIREALRTPRALTEVEYDSAAGYPTRLLLYAHLAPVDGDRSYFTRRLSGRP